LSLTCLQNPEQLSDYLLTTTVLKNLAENDRERSWMPRRIDKPKIILKAWGVPAINLGLLLGNAARIESFQNNPKLSTLWLGPKSS